MSPKAGKARQVELEQSVSRAAAGNLRDECCGLHSDLVLLILV